MSNLGNKEILSKNLNRFLTLNNKTRNEVCEELGIKYTTFTDWINGNKYPRIDKIEMLANYFNVSKSDIIEDKHPGEKLIYVDNSYKIITNDKKTNNKEQEDLQRLITYYTMLDEKTKNIALNYMEQLYDMQKSFNEELRAAHNDNAESEEEIDKINRDFDKF